jgi:hypothetical protein
MHNGTIFGIGITVFVMLVLGGLAIYFIPSFIAFSRRKRNRGAILALNLLTGWSLIGWVGALVWALAHETAQAQSASAPTWNPMELGGEPQFAKVFLHDTWTAAPQAAAWHVCRTAGSVWRCATHGLMLCAQCRPYYQCPPPSYGCNWQPVQASPKRTVMTSPLGGLR